MDFFSQIQILHRIYMIPFYISNDLSLHHNEYGRLPLFEILLPYVCIDLICQIQILLLDLTKIFVSFLHESCHINFVLAKLRIISEKKLESYLSWHDVWEIRHKKTFILLLEYRSVMRISKLISGSSL